MATIGTYGNPAISSYVIDADGYYVATNVETALQEIYVTKNPVNQGYLSGFAVTDDGGLNISWTAGTVFDFNNQQIVVVAAGAGGCTTDVINYLYWDAGAVLVIGVVEPTGNQVLVAEIYCQVNDIFHIMEMGALDRREHWIAAALNEIFPNIVTNGLTVTEDPNAANVWDVQMAAGLFYHHVRVEHPIAAIVYSRITNMRRWYHVAGVWTSDTNAEISITQYDDGNNLVAVTPAQYHRSVFFTDGTITHWVYPQAEYATVAAAIDAPDPVLPPGLQELPKLTAIVIQTGDAAFPAVGSDQWIDVRPMIGQVVGAPVSDHGGLSGLADDDHTQYVLADGSRAITGAFTVQGLLTSDGLVPEADLADDLGTALLTWQGLYVQDIYDAAGNMILSNDGAGNIDALANLSCNIVFTGAQTVDGVDVSAISLSNMPAAASGNIDAGGQAITNVGNVDGVDVSAIVAFTTITGITNDVVADALADTLTLASGNAMLTIVGTAATDTITFTIVEAQINHDNIGGVSADDHHAQSHDLTTHSDVSLADPGADQIVFWDDTDSQFEFLIANTGLSIAGNNLNCDIIQYTDGLARTACVEDDVYGAGWNGDLTHAPSQNAVYDKIAAMDILIAANTTVVEVEAVITAELVNGQSIDNAIDALINTHNVANRHIDHSAVTITAGVGLSGGGTIAADRTIDCDITQYTDGLARTACVSDVAYGAGWNAVTTIAPSKNAVYDQLVTHYADANEHHAQSHTIVSHSDATLAAPGSDQIVFWDHSDLKFEFLVANTGLSIAGNNLNCDITQYTDGLARTACLEDDVYGAGWDADVTHAPTQNAVYDKINAMDTLIAANTTVAEVEAIIIAELVDGQSIDNAIDALVATENELVEMNDVSLADPGADQIVFWDDSDSQFEFLIANTGLSIAGNNLNCDITQYTDGLARTACLEDDVYGAGWNGDTTHAPTQNAVYDKIAAMDTLIAANTTPAEAIAAVVAENPLTLTNALNIGSIVAGVADYDKFLVSDGGLVKFRTGAEVLSDIGASASGHLHDTQTLQHDGVNSNGGAFPFTTSGAVTFSQDVIVNGANVDINNVPTPAVLTTITQDATQWPVRVIPASYTAGDYVPMIEVSVANNIPTKPRVGIWAKISNDDSELYFGTQNVSATGITAVLSYVDKVGNWFFEGNITVTGGGVTLGADVSFSRGAANRLDIASGDSITFADGGATINEFSIDGTLAGNSDTALPTEQAVKTYVDAQVGAENELVEMNDVSLADPGADQIVFWDDSDSQFEFLVANTGLSIAGNNLNCDITQYTDGLARTACLEDDVYGAGWNGDTTHAPTQNAVYDKIAAMDTLIAANTTVVEVEAVITAELVNGQSIDNAIDTLIAAAIEDDVYGAGWNGDVTHAPTQNAVYDKIAAMDTTIGAIVAFKTITGITNDVVADALTDTLTLASANNRLTIVGTTATDTITFTLVEGNISHDAIADVSADDHHAQVHTMDSHSATSLADPGADRIVFWDESDDTFEFLVANTGLSIAGNNLNCDITQYTDGLARTACLEDDVYGAGWNGDVTHAPTQNAVYDKIAAMDTLIAANTTPAEAIAAVVAENPLTLTNDLVVSGGTITLNNQGAGGDPILDANNAAQVLDLTGSFTISVNLSLGIGATINEFSIDGTLAGNSDTALPTEQAVKTYADAVAGGAHFHDTHTLQLDGVNSDGGAFPFTTAGAVSFNQAIKNPADNMGFYTGAGDDLRIYHSGTHTYIEAGADAGTLYLNQVNNNMSFNTRALYIDLTTSFRIRDRDDGDAALFVLDTSARTLLIGNAGDPIVTTMYSELDMTGALACIDLNPASTGTKYIIDITPTANLVAGSTWRGINMDLTNLDPATGAISSIHGVRVNAAGLASVDKDARVYGYLFYGSAVETCYGFYVGMGEITQAGESHTCHYSYLSGALSTTATYKGYRVAWGSVTRDANAPKLEGVDVVLPANYTGFGACYAAYFSGDGRSVKICDTTYALDVSGIVRTSANMTVGGDLYVSGSQIWGSAFILKLGVADGTTTTIYCTDDETDMTASCTGGDGFSCHRITYDDLTPSSSAASKTKIKELNSKDISDSLKGIKAKSWERIYDRGDVRIGIVADDLPESIQEKKVKDDPDAVSGYDLTALVSMMLTKINYLEARLEILEDGK